MRMIRSGPLKQSNGTAAPDPSGKQVLHWSDELKGFGVLCSGTSGAKSYVVQHALPDGTRRRVTVARTNVITLDEAQASEENPGHILQRQGSQVAGPRQPDAQVGAG
jgi:hypothetical protein